MVSVLMMALLAPAARGWTSHNTGAGIVYKLGVTQDVTLERGTANFNYLRYLIVSRHPQYPNKRSLVQFEKLPSSCSPSRIKHAYMYLYYAYAHKASWHSVSLTPFIARHMKVRVFVANLLTHLYASCSLVQLPSH